MTWPLGVKANVVSVMTPRSTRTPQVEPAWSWIGLRCPFCHEGVAPEATDGGPIAFVEDGDPIVIDVPNRKLDVLVDEATMAKRKEGWKPKDPRYTSGFLAKYAKLVQSASRGAITNVG